MLPTIALTLFQTSIVLSKNIWRFTDTIDDSHLMEMNVSDITVRYFNILTISNTIEFQ